MEIPKHSLNYQQFLKLAGSDPAPLMGNLSQTDWQSVSPRTTLECDRRHSPTSAPSVDGPHGRRGAVGRRVAALWVDLCLAGARSLSTLPAECPVHTEP